MEINLTLLLFHFSYIFPTTIVPALIGFITGTKYAIKMSWKNCLKCLDLHYLISIITICVIVSLILSLIASNASLSFQETMIVIQLCVNVALIISVIAGIINTNKSLNLTRETIAVNHFSRIQEIETKIYPKIIIKKFEFNKNNNKANIKLEYFEDIYDLWIRLYNEYERDISPIIKEADMVKQAKRMKIKIEHIFINDVGTKKTRTIEFPSEEFSLFEDKEGNIIDRIDYLQFHKTTNKNFNYLNLEIELESNILGYINIYFNSRYHNPYNYFYEVIQREKGFYCKIIYIDYPWDPISWASHPYSGFQYKKDDVLQINLSKPFLEDNE